MGTAAFRDHPSGRHLAGRSILLADDDADIRKMLRVVLEAVGAVVSEASSRKQTIARLQDGGVDAVVLDWNLAGMTGERILADISTLSPPFTGPILIISGDQRVEAMAATGAPTIAVLLKPFLPVDLVANLGALLATAR
jgi:DNA-binding response OmpR family regulator